MDYKVRGFTRGNLGSKLFIDHAISYTLNYIIEDMLCGYMAFDVNIFPGDIFHSKMRKRGIRLSELLFGEDVLNPVMMW